MNKLKELRTSKGLNQKDIGEVLDVEIAAISKYENGRVSLTEKQLKLLSTYFNVSVDYILGLTDDPNSNLDVTEKMLKDYTTENYEEAEEISNGFTYYLKLAQEQAGDLIVHYINHHELDGKGFNEMMKSIKIADILCKKCGKLDENSNILDLPDDIAEQKGLLNIKKDLERDYEAHLKAEKILNKHTKNENKK